MIQPIYQPSGETASRPQRQPQQQSYSPLEPMTQEIWMTLTPQQQYQYQQQITIQQQQQQLISSSSLSMTPSPLQIPLMSSNSNQPPQTPLISPLSPTRQQQIVMGESIEIKSVPSTPTTNMNQIHSITAGAPTSLSDQVIRAGQQLSEGGATSSSVHAKVAQEATYVHSGANIPRAANAVDTGASASVIHAVGGHEKLRLYKQKEVAVRRRRKIALLFGELATGLECGPTDKASILSIATIIVRYANERGILPTSVEATADDQSIDTATSGQSFASASEYEEDGLGSAAIAPASASTYPSTISSTPNLPANLHFPSTLPAMPLPPISIPTGHATPSIGNDAPLSTDGSAAPSSIAIATESSEQTLSGPRGLLARLNPFQRSTINQPESNTDTTSTIPANELSVEGSPNTTDSSSTASTSTSSSTGNAKASLTAAFSSVRVSASAVQGSVIASAHSMKERMAAGASVVKESVTGSVTVVKESVLGSVAVMKDTVSKSLTLSTSASSNSSEVTDLIHQLQQEEKRSAAIHKEYKLIISEKDGIIREREAELDREAAEIKLRFREMDQWKQRYEQEFAKSQVFQQQLTNAANAITELQIQIQSKENTLVPLANQLALTERERDQTRMILQSLQSNNIYSNEIVTLKNEIERLKESSTFTSTPSTTPTRLPSTTSAALNSVPSPRLVGIEPNLGPQDSSSVVPAAFSSVSTSSPSSSTSPQLSSLPLVLIQSIYHHLPLKGLLSLSRCNRLFYQIADTDIAWKGYQTSPSSAVSSPMKWSPRIIVLDSSHTYHALHTSLLLRHGSIHWDVCYDFPINQAANDTFHGLVTPSDSAYLIFNPRLEAKVLSENIRYLNFLLVGDGFESIGLEAIFQQQIRRPTLQTLVLSVNNPQAQRFRCLATSTFLQLVSITSLMKLTFHSTYYESGHLSLLTGLPLLSTLYLIEEPNPVNGRLFDRTDLLTLGELPSLTNLSIINTENHSDGGNFTVDFLVQFLQQPNLNKKLLSLTIGQIISDHPNNRRIETDFSLHKLLTAFDGFDRLEELKFMTAIDHTSLQFNLLFALSNYINSSMSTSDEEVTRVVSTTMECRLIAESPEHLLVRRIPPTWTSVDARIYFCRYGPVISADTFLDPQPPGPTPCAFVKYATHADAQHALQQLNGGFVDRPTSWPSEAIFLPALRYLSYAHGLPAIIERFFEHIRPSLSVRWFASHDQLDRVDQFHQVQHLYPRFKVQRESSHPSNLVHLRRRSERVNYQFPIGALAYDGWMGSVDVGEPVLTANYHRLSHPSQPPSTRPPPPTDLTTQGIEPNPGPIAIGFTPTILSLPSTIVSQLSEQYLIPMDLCSLGRTCKFLFGDVKQCKILHSTIPFHCAIHFFTHPRSIWSIGRIISLRIESHELAQLDQLCSKYDFLSSLIDGSSQVPIVPSAISSLHHIRELTIGCDNSGLGDGPFCLPFNITSLHFSNEVGGSPIPLTKFILPNTIARMTWSNGRNTTLGEIHLARVAKWPSHLKELLNVYDGAPLDGLHLLPEGLLNLTFVDYLTANFHLVKFPNSVTNLQFSIIDTKVPFNQILLPTSLKRLKLSIGQLFLSATYQLPSFAHLPKTFENLQLRVSDRTKFSHIELPASIKQFSIMFHGESHTQLEPPRLAYLSSASSLTSLLISRTILAQIDWTKCDIPNLIRIKIQPSNKHANQPLHSNDLPANLLELDLTRKSKNFARRPWMTQWVGDLPQHLQTLHLVSYSSELLSHAFPTSLTSISFQDCFDGNIFDANKITMQPPALTILPNIKFITLGDTHPSTLEAWSRTFPEAQVSGDLTTHLWNALVGPTQLCERLTYSAGGHLVDRFGISSDLKKWSQDTGPAEIDPLYDTFPSPRTVVADTPPAERLVGIELNPGPSSTPAGPLTSSSTSPVSDSSFTHPIATAPDNHESTNSHHASLTWSERTAWISERNEWNRMDPTSVYIAVLMDTAELVKDLADIVLTYLEPPHYYQPYYGGRTCEPGSYLIPLPRSARPIAVALQLKFDSHFRPDSFIRPDVYIITQFHGKAINEDQENTEDNLEGSAHPLPTITTSSTMSSPGWSYRPTDQEGVIEVISNSAPPHNQVGYGLLLDHLKMEDSTVQLCHMFPSNWSHLSSFQFRRRPKANWFTSTFITFTFFYTTPIKSTPMLNSLSFTTDSSLTTPSIDLDTPCLPLPCKNSKLRSCQRGQDALLLSYPFTSMAQTCHRDASTIPSTLVGDRSREELRWAYHQAARKGGDAVQQWSNEFKEASEAMLLERTQLSTQPWLPHSDLYLDEDELPSDDQTATDAAFDQLMRDYHQIWLSDPANHSYVPFTDEELTPEPGHQSPQAREVAQLERVVELELGAVRMELNQAHQTIEQLNATISTKDKELIALKDHYEQTTIPNLVNTFQQQIKAYVTQSSDLTNRLRSFEDERRHTYFESYPTPPINSTPIMRLLPQTMFKDGLHLISSYLDQHDFVASLQVCHHWANSFSSSTSRGMSYPIEVDGTFRSSLPSMRLRHHFTRLTVRGDDPLYLTAKQLFSIGRELPSLTQFPPLKIQADPKHRRRTPRCIWPRTLKELSINLEETTASHLIRAISTCMSLVRLSLFCWVFDEAYLSLFQSFEQLVHLEYFELHGHSLSPVDVLGAMRWRTGPPNLRVLKFDPEHFFVPTFSQYRWPMLEDVDLPDELKEGELALILSSAPNLRVIRLETCPDSDLVLLKQFQSLHTLRLGSSLRGPDESDKIQALCDCTRLTSLEFSIRGVPQLSSSWTQLSRSLLNLVEIQFNWRVPKVLDVLLPFQSLTKLVFKGIGGEGWRKYVRNYFRSASVMPQLCHIEMVDSIYDDMDWIWRKDGGTNNTVRGDQFRESPPLSTSTTNEIIQQAMTSIIPTTVAREPPLEDLTTQGIESNPGPKNEATFLSTPLNPIPPLFNDGLHLIFSYLPTRDWIAAMNTCHHWSMIGASAPTRDLTFDYEPDDGPCLMLPPKRLLRHFTSTIFCLFRFEELLTLFDQLPQLITMTLLVDSKIVSDQSVTFPSHLRSLSISLNESALPQLLLTSIGTAASTLTSLTIERFSPSHHFTSEFGVMLMSLTHLIQLTLHTYAPYEPCIKFDFIHESELTALPDTLTELNLFNGTHTITSSLHLLTPMPNLRQMAISSSYTRADVTEVERDTLLRVRQFAPNLTSMAPQWIDYSDFSAHLHLFEHLESYEIGRFSGGLGETDEVDIISQTLGRCPSLTSIRFGEWLPIGIVEWRTLAYYIPHLRQLSFEINYQYPSEELEWLLDGLPLLKQLQSMTIVGEVDSSELDQLKDLFRDTALFPELTYLMIGDQDRESLYFEYDLLRGINTQFRVSNDQHSDKPTTSNAMTQQLSLPPEGDGCRTIEPLVGIELNPGPECPITLTTITAQTIFKDALHLIFSYDTLSSVVASMLVCKHWYDCGRSIPCRHLTAYTDMHPSDDDIPASAASGLSGCTPSDLLSLFNHQRPPPPISFRRHFTTLFRRPGPPPLTMNGNQLCWMMAYYSSVTHIACAVHGDATYLHDCQWPTSLTSLSLTLERPNCPNLLLALTQQLASKLEYLSLNGLDDEHLDGISNLEHFDSLTHLSLTDKWSRYPIDFISGAPWSKLPQSITYLDLCGGRDQALTSIHTLPPLLNLTRLEMPKLQSGDLQRYFTFAPNLRTLAPHRFYAPDLHQISLFRSLDTIHFRGVALDVNDCNLVSYLSVCPSLTQLQFDQCPLLTRDSWVALERGLPLLRVFETALKETSMQHFIDVLTPSSFIHLERLIALCHPSQALKDHLNNPNICPKLTALTIGVRWRGQLLNFDSIHGLNTDNYRLRPQSTG